MTAKRKQEADLRAVFLWLLGENGEFPESEPGKRYGFRSELRQRLEAIGFSLAPQPSGKKGRKK